MTNVLKARQGDSSAACKGVFNILSACGGGAATAAGLLCIPGSGRTPTLLHGPSALCPALPGAESCGYGTVQPSTALRSKAGGVLPKWDHRKYLSFPSVSHNPKFKHLPEERPLQRKRVRGQFWHCWRPLREVVVPSPRVSAGVPAGIAQGGPVEPSWGVLSRVRARRAGSAAIPYPRKSGGPGSCCRGSLLTC